MNKRKQKRILKKLKNGKISPDKVKIYLTSIGRIVAAGELSLRKREEK